MGSVFLASPAVAHQGNSTTPTPVTVHVEFGDNVCVGNEYTEPSMTGTVAPGSTVEVVYTALEGFVIEGQSTFTHIFPAEPSSVTDCEKAEQPAPLVRERLKVRTDWDGVLRRDWDIVTAYVWNGSEWVLGEPEVQNYTGWVLVRALTPAEQKQLGCLDAGLTDAAVAPAGPLWLAPLLGGVIMLGLAAFSRLKALGQQV